MGSCESCGNKTETLILCKIEGVELKVCRDCKSLGEVVKPKKPAYTYTKPKRVRYEKIVIETAPDLLKTAREARNMRQIDLAKMLQIKESLVHHIETREIQMTLALAAKIEDALDLILIETVEIN